MREPRVSPVCTRSLKNRLIQKTTEVTLQDALPVSPGQKQQSFRSDTRCCERQTSHEFNLRQQWVFPPGLTLREAGSAGVLSAACLEH